MVVWPHRDQRQKRKKKGIFDGNRLHSRGLGGLHIMAGLLSVNEADIKLESISQFV